MQTKLCSKCKLELTVDNFEKRKESRDGYRGQCKSCRRGYKNKPSKPINIKPLKVKYENPRKWRDREKSILIEKYPFMSNKYISENHLPHRTPSQIQDYATKKLKLKKDKNYRPQWEDWQIEYLKENYCNMDLHINEISNYIGKHHSTVTAMANTLGLTRNREAFSEEEKELILKYYADMSNMGLLDNYLPHKTIGQLNNFARRNNLFKSEEYIKEHRIRHGINNLIRINNTKEPTNPEIITESILKDLNIVYEFQAFDKYYWIDFYLPDINLIIEVQGDYFHCHPKFNFTYNALNKNNIITKDKRKHSYFKNKGVEILYLWEYDLNNNIDMCKKLVELYVNSDGKLNDYHSYNYMLKENILELSDELIVIGY